MTKYKIGDIVEWFDDKGVWVIEEIIDIINTPVNEQRYIILSLWTRDDMISDTLEEGIDNEFEISTYENDNCQLSIKYIKTKQFQKDLKEIIEE